MRMNLTNTNKIWGPLEKFLSYQKASLCPNNLEIGPDQLLLKTNQNREPETLRERVDQSKAAKHIIELVS